MITKIRNCAVKEVKLLVRDPAGLAILFLLPVVMVFIITIIQDAAINSLTNQPMEVLVVNHDQNELGNSVFKELQSGNMFIPMEVKSEVSETEIANWVRIGKYKIAIIIDSGSTDLLNFVSNDFLEKNFFQTSDSIAGREAPERKIKMYFDPTLQLAYKNSISAMIRAIVQKTQSEMMLNHMSEKLSEVLPVNNTIRFPDESPLKIEDNYATEQNSAIAPNSVQHNVPAWSIFAMFFIVIPLGTNLVREKESGIVRRINTLPGAYLPSLVSKLWVYTTVGLFQFILLVFMGIYVLPLVHLPQLQIGHAYAELVAMALVCALAGVSFGLMIGSLATTHEQSASFGSIIVVIMAALGGIWVPSFVMPEIFRTISAISPMNWALQGFYEILLRESGFRAISIHLVKLIMFAAIAFAVSVYLNFKLIKR